MLQKLGRCSSNSHGKQILNVNVGHFKIIDYIKKNNEFVSSHQIFGRSVQLSSSFAKSFPYVRDAFSDPEGAGAGGSSPPPPFHLESHKSIGFLSNTGLDPLKNHKATKPAFNDGQSSDRQRKAI